jgi:hypothetical protein
MVTPAPLAPSSSLVPAPLPSSSIQPSSFLLLSPSTVPSLNPIPLALPSIHTGGAPPVESFSWVAQQAHQRNPTNPSISSKSSLPSAAQARFKLSSLQNLRSQGKPVCFRCGDHGHTISSYRKSLVCFACGQLGHRTH